MTPFSPETWRALEAHGWREDRHIDTSEYERLLLAAGHEDCKAASDFLQRYGDLEVYPNDFWGSYLDTRLSPLLEIMNQSLVSVFSDLVGRPLYYIGSYIGDLSSLLMDSSGRVYHTVGGITNSMSGIDLFLFAASGEEAIEKIVRQYLTEERIKGEWVANLWRAARQDGTVHDASRVNPNYS
jgi:hypothetical protein